VSFPRYISYAPTTVEWIRELPCEWEILPLKRIVRLVTDRASARHHPVALENIQSWTGRFLSSESEFEGKGTSFQPGDILFGKLRPYLAKVFLANTEGEAVGDFHVLRPDERVHRRFLFYQLLTREFIEVVDGSTFGAKMPRASWEFVGGMPIALPPVADQGTIAAFLDRETAKIDTLVAEQRRLIELLKEKRQAVIAHTVASGLNRDVPMTPSGIEWLGDVPAHWQISRLKRISPFIAVGIVVNPSSYVSDQGLPFIYGGDIRQESIDWQNARRISSEDSADNSKTQLHEGDLLTVRVGAPGVTAVVPRECEGGNCASVMLVRRGAFSSDWLCYVMNSRIVRYQVEVVQYGAAQEQFNISHAVDFMIPTPPVDEQYEIAAALGPQVRALDELTRAAGRTIELLNERRGALVSGAVTGQIDVRYLDASEPA
jgi:type I restriction enzyme, S subunit